MFYSCSKLKSIDLSDFNISKAINMSGMFSRCNYLTSLNLSSFDTSNVVNMNMMFQCMKLTSIICPNGFDCRNVTNMHNMFLQCSSELNSPLHLKNVKSSLIESGSSPDDWVIEMIGGTRGIHYIVDSVASS